jgi:hypothetical protein
MAPSVHSNQPSTGRSSLECLPVELLEIIFFQCLNVNLPRASPVLGDALSSFGFQVRLVELVFSDEFHTVKTDDSYPELKAILSPATDWEADISDLQTQLLESKWMTMGFWRKYMPIYMEKTISNQFRTLNIDWMDGTPGHRVTRALVAERLLAAFQSDREGNRPRASSFLEFEWKPTAMGDIKAEKIRLAVGLHEGIIALDVKDSVGSRCRSWMMLHCFPCCRIPRKLLHGPWTNEKCRFLEMVVLGGARIDWYNSTVGEVAERGLFDAIRERNLRAVRLLLGHVSNVWPESINRYIPFRYASEYPNYITKWVPPRSDYLVYAVVAQDCNQDIVEYLLQQRGKRVAIEDGTLVEWAVQKKLDGDERGPWLLEKIKQYPGKLPSPKKK